MLNDFDTIIERRSTYASKWQVNEGELPLSIADMDFKCSKKIRDAIQRRLDNGIFGYTDVPDAWYEAYMYWWEKRHNFKIAKDWLMFCTGVVPAISSTVRKITTPAEKVVVLTPVYNIFFNSIYNNGRYINECKLKEIDGRYEIDFIDLEEKLKDPQTTLLIFCNPHNPIGKIYTKEELAKVGELCAKHHVTVLSDEIHCDLVDPGEHYIPFASVNDTCKYNSITCVAPSKAFNLAGLQSSAIIVPNKDLYHKINRAINTDEIAEPNAFAIDATIAAFKESEGWLDELRAYVYENKCYIRDYIAHNIPELKVLDSKATYLLWIDTRALGHDAGYISEYIRKTSGLILSDGDHYRGNGYDYLRMNTAYPKKIIADAMTRLKKSIETLKEEDHEKNN